MFGFSVVSGSFGFSDGKADLGTPVFGFDNAGDGVHVGSYPINLSGLSNGDYEISYAVGGDRGVLTVTPRDLSVTPDSGQSKVYGASDPALTYSHGTLVNGDTGSVFTGALALGCRRKRRRHDQRGAASRPGRTTRSSSPTG